MNVYEARRKYIESVYNKLKKYQIKGYLIFNDRNQIVETIENQGYCKNFALLIDSIIYYLHDKEFDNGYYTKISDLKAIFSQFKIVNPKHIKRLK